jgi:N-methylhydantoinase B
LSRGIRLDADATVTVHLDRTRHRPWGVEGGGEAKGSRVVVEDLKGLRELPGKSTTNLPRGTMLIIETAGGGGWGISGRRAPAARDEDERNQLQPHAQEAAE